MATHSLILRDVNWLGDGALDDVAADGLPVFAKVRSTRPPVEALLLRDDDGVASVELIGGESGVAPGQACVLYGDDSADARVLGGGFIQRSERDTDAEGQLQTLIAKPVEEAAGKMRWQGRSRLKIGAVRRLTYARSKFPLQDRVEFIRR